MPIQKTHFASLGIAVLLACAIPAFAQELQGLVADDGLLAETNPTEQFENRFRIGIDCNPAPEVLRVHLGLDEDSGLLVNAVMDGSPADEAGMKRFDVVVKANGQPVSSIVDLSRAVNKTGDGTMSLNIIRKGAQRVVSVTPEERDEDEVHRLRRGFANRIGRGWSEFGGDFGKAQEELQRALENMQAFGPMQGTPWQGNAWRRIGPGIVLDDQHDMPGEFNLSMQVERSNNGPVKIKVKRGNDEWEVTEEELDELPDDIRPMVENMLSGKRPGFGFMTPGFQQLLPPTPQGVPRRSRGRTDQRLQERFDGLELRMQELQNAIRSIQKGD